MKFLYHQIEQIRQTQFRLSGLQFLASLLTKIILNPDRVRARHRAVTKKQSAGMPTPILRGGDHFYEVSPRLLAVLRPARPVAASVEAFDSLPVTDRYLGAQPSP